MKKCTKDHLEEFLSRTGNLLLHLLNTCNLYCSHCYLDASKNKNKTLPFSLVNRVMNEADKLGIQSVQFSGGEPFLYPRIMEILEATKEKSFTVTVSTNGTLLKNKHIDQLSVIQANVVTSIDGPAEYHDSFRRAPGCFEKTEQTISRLTAIGVPVKVVTTLCCDNIKFIDWCAQWANRHQVTTLQFQPLAGIGRGQKIHNKRIQQAMLNDIFIKLSDLAASYDEKRLQIKMTYQSRDFMLKHPCSAFVCNGKKCHRGVAKELKKIVIREDGVILPELVDIDRRFAIGNLYQKSLTDNLLNYLEKGYSRFDQFCRDIYHETVPENPFPLIPWNEILSKRSKSYVFPENISQGGTF